MSEMIYCQKFAKLTAALDYQPYPGELGQRIQKNIGKEAWEAWINHQTKLINEYRLSLIDPEARKFLEKEMEKFLFSGDSEQPPGYVPEEK